jgi:hypothetical protein
MQTKSSPIWQIVVRPYGCQNLACGHSLSAYQEWALSSRPGNRARDKATVPASGIWRDAARRGQKPTLQPFPTMQFFGRLSLIHGESECRITTQSRSHCELKLISNLKITVHFSFFAL